MSQSPSLAMGAVTTLADVGRSTQPPQLLGAATNNRRQSERVKVKLEKSRSQPLRSSRAHKTRRRASTVKAT